MAISLTSIREDNVELLLFLHSENFNMVYDDAEYLKIAEGVVGFGFYAHIDGVLAGEITAQWKDEKCALYINTLSVLEEHRRRGVASALLQKAIDMASHVDYVYLHTEADNQNSQALYQKFGFVEQKRIPGYYDTVDAIKMVRINELSPIALLSKNANHILPTQSNTPTSASDI